MTAHELANLLTLELAFCTMPAVVAAYINKQSGIFIHKNAQEVKQNFEKM